MVNNIEKLTQFINNTIKTWIVFQLLTFPCEKLNEFHTKNCSLTYQSRRENLPVRSCENSPLIPKNAYVTSTKYVLWKNIIIQFLYCARSEKIRVNIMVFKFRAVNCRLSIPELRSIFLEVLNVNLLFHIKVGWRRYYQARQQFTSVQEMV